MYFLFLPSIFSSDNESTPLQMPFLINIIFASLVPQCLTVPSPWEMLLYKYTVYRMTKSPLWENYFQAWWQGIITTILLHKKQIPMFKPAHVPLVLLLILMRPKIWLTGLKLYMFITFSKENSENLRFHFNWLISFKSSDHIEKGSK